MYYVYVYKDPTTYQPFYIGKGKGNRYKVHLKETVENYKNKRKYDRIQSLIKHNLKPIIEFHSHYNNENDAYDAEEVLIKKYGRIDFDKGGILTNIALNSKPSSAALKDKTYEEIYGVEGAKIRREKLSKARKGIKTKPCAEETKQKISDGNKGIKHGPLSEEHRQKLSEKMKENTNGHGNKGKKLGPQSEGHRQKISEKMKGQKRGPYKKRKN